MIPKIEVEGRKHDKLGYAREIFAKVNEVDERERDRTSHRDLSCAKLKQRHYR